MILLQQRMVTLLVCHSTINVILSWVARFYVWQKAIITCQQLIACLTGENQVRLIGVIVHHNLRGRSLILLTRRLLYLRHWWLDTQTFVALNLLLVIARYSLWRPVLLMLLPNHLAGCASNACSRHWVIQFRLVARCILLLHFRLSVVGIVQTLVSQVVLSACVLSLYLPAVLRRLLLLMVRLLLLVVMLLHLLHILALLVFLCWICNILHLLVAVIVELLKILLVRTNHHGRILTTASLALTGEGHILMILLGKCCIWIISRLLYELVLWIQNIDVL